MRKRIGMIVTVISVAALTTVNSFALDPTPAPIGESIGASLTPVKTDALAALTAIAPVALAILGGFLVWRYGVRFFKGLAK